MSVNPQVQQVPGVGTANILWVIHDDLMVSFTQFGFVPHQLYTKYLDAARPAHIRYVLTTSIGSTTVTNGQREATASVFADKHVVAVVEDRLTLGIISALGWQGLRIRCFDWRQLREAVVELAAPGRSIDEVARTALRLRELSYSPTAKTA